MFRIGWALTLLWAAPVAAQLHVTATFNWAGNEFVKGISGIEILDHGTRFVAVSDFGTVIDGTIVRENGHIQDMVEQRFSFPKARSGRQLVGAERDAEGIAMAPDGTYYIVFERFHRVARLTDPNGAPDYLGKLYELPELDGNTGVEALALSPEGRLLVIPEFADDPTFPIYQFAHGTWQITHRLPKSNGFEIVGADFDDDGLLYVLERNFRVPFFQSRIRRVDLARSETETLWRSRWGQFSNLEGLSVWTSAQGETKITTVVDNNGYALLRTQVVELVLSDDP
ncbi:MAG: esterase-like activity of phytase family protein [Pseudomonadota bacterium]